MRLKPGRAYVMLGGNKPLPTHYQVRTDPVAKVDRWVPVSCGVHVISAEQKPTGNRGTPEDRGDSGGLVLAVSWQPAFCETRPSKPECESQTGTRFDATHFTLHGLWPQPRDNVYCGVSPVVEDLSSDGKWEMLPPLALDETLRRELDTVMPGTASFLHRHEWTKHGTCYGEAPDAYFRDSLALMRALNASPVRDLFADAIGRDLRTAAIRAAFDGAFGAGAGRRVSVSCKTDGGRRLIVELRLALSGRPGEAAGLGDLIAAASETGRGCGGGLVDPVGLQ